MTKQLCADSTLPLIDDENNELLRTMEKALPEHVKIITCYSTNAR